MNTPQTNDGGPAFPCESYGLKNGKETTVPAQGMTLRDWIAGQAMAGLLSSWSSPGCEFFEADNVAKVCIRIRRRQIRRNSTTTPQK
jgi:hypothetical protein